MTIARMAFFSSFLSSAMAFGSKSTPSAWYTRVAMASIFSASDRSSP